MPDYWPPPEQPPPVLATRIVRMLAKIVIIFCAVMLAVTLVGIALQEMS